MSINENNVSQLTNDELSKMSAEELDEVIDLLIKINKESRGIKTEHQNVLAAATMYRREMEKAGKTIKENENIVSRLSDTINKSLGTIKTAVEGTFFKPLTELSGAWGKADQAANEFGKTIGGNAKAVSQLRDESIKFANDVHIGAKYNTSIAEMIKLQEGISKTVGRNLQISDKQRETLLATSKLMGQNTNEFVKRLENMGVGLEKSGDIAAKMFNEASKSGISFEKYSQSVTENLTKVQSYGFRNGVEGLTAMAKKAVEVNMSINEAFKVADKIQSTSGGIQEAIKMSANLQVLGGNFARFGDAMGMLYEGLNDVEGLQDRMVKMFSGNATIENGQVKISGADRLRMRSAAEALGVSSDEMFNMVSRGAVKERVEQQIRGNKRIESDAELKELIANTATLNKEGQAVINIGGKEKRIDEVTSADKDYLKNLQKSESEDIKDIAQILRGYTDIQEGFRKEIENKKASAFSEIGKFTKMIYGKMGESNLILTIIKDAFLAQVLSGAIGSVGSVVGNIKGMFSRRGGGAASGGGFTGGGISAGGAVSNTIYKPGQTFKYKGKEYTVNSKGSGFLTKNAAGKTVNAGKSAEIGKAATKAATRSAKIVNGAIGGALAGATTAFGYLADGSFKGNKSDKNRAWGGTIGATIGGLASAIPVIGPIAGIVGAEVGKFLGEATGKWFDKRRFKKKASLTEELGGKNSEKAQAFASLSDNYSRRELKKIKKALEDGRITGDELKPSLLKKIAESGDKDLIEKFGSKDAKAKINEQIEKLNASIESGNFSMETGEFSIGNANFGAIEPVAMARGGYLQGPSDINGPGMPIQGTNIVVGGGEFVSTAKSTERNRSALEAGNRGATLRTTMASGGIIDIPQLKLSAGGDITPKKIQIPNTTGDTIKVPVKISNIAPSVIKNPMQPIIVKPGKGEVASNTRGGIDKLEVAPVKLDVSGTIKLDSNGQQVDLNAIMNNPAFLTQLSQMIERRLADNINGGNFKELKKNKQHTF